MRPRQTVTVLAPAKINLLLYVLGPGPKGYHNILSLIQMVDLHDHLTLTREPSRSGVRLVTRSRSIPRGEGNLVVRAAQAFMHRYGIETGLRVELKKNIPVSAGLGGGSSDAAATLHGLCRLCRLDPPRAGLIAMGQTLGSDVPFFFEGPTAWVSGIGDAVCPTTLDRPAWAVLVNPGFGVSTAWAYSELDRAQPIVTPDREASLQKMGLTLENNRIKIPSRTREAFPLTKRSFSLHNDLEAITIRRHPVIATIKEDLYSLGAEEALMSGSGPTVFGLFPDRHSAARAAAALRRGQGRRRTEGRGGWKVWVVRLLNRSPW